MPDQRGNGADSVLEYRSLPLPRGGGGRCTLWPTVIVFLIVIVEVISHCHVLASSCPYLGYYFDYMPNMPTPPATFECLKLTSDISVKICDKQVEARLKMIRKRNIRLHFCSSYPIYNLIGASDKDNPCRIDTSIADCTDCLERLLSIDQQISNSIAGFQDLLYRMDCNSVYSVNWNCTHCKRAYKEWLCATKLTYYHNHHPVPPCGDFCSSVEERCPFFPPDNDDTHAGDPSFICKDPEIASQSSIYGHKPGCYNLCHLLENVDEDACHTIDLTSNKNVTVSNGTVVTSSSSGQHQRYSVQDVILQLLLVWILRTVLEHTSIGLT